jgi:hypothetical protein
MEAKQFVKWVSFVPFQFSLLQLMEHDPQPPSKLLQATWKKRFHNHYNNQTNPKKQTKQKTKPKTQPPEKLEHTKLLQRQPKEN